MMNLQGTLQKVGQGQKNPTATWIMTWGPTLIVGFAYVVFAKRMFRLIWRFAVNIFFSDQWAFNDARLFQKHSWWQTFVWQHGWHRQGVGGVFAALIEPLFRWNGRIEAFIVGAIVALTTICALWLKRRLFGQLSVFDALIPALFLTPAQYESLLVTPNFAQGAFPLLLIVIYCLAWTWRQNCRYPLILVINFLATFTGFSLFLGLLTPFFLVVDYRATAPEARPAKERFYAAMALAIATVASFFLGYSFKPFHANVSGVVLQSPLRFCAAYVTVMFADPFEIHRIGLATRATGTILVIAALYVLVRGLSRLLLSKARSVDFASRERAFIAVILITLSITLCVNAAYGRALFGLSSAQASRYVIYVLPGLLGLYFGLLEIRADLIRRVLVTAFFMAAVISSFRLSPVLPYFPGIKQRWKTCYLQFEDAKKCDQVVAFPYTHTPDGVNIEEKLRYLKQTRQNLYSETK